jgi:hypothetical protein
VAGHAVHPSFSEVGDSEPPVAAIENTPHTPTCRCQLGINDCTAAIVLQRHATIVIMEACKLSSRRRVESTVCAVLPALGIVW